MPRSKPKDKGLRPDVDLLERLKRLTGKNLSKAGIARLLDVRPATVTDWFSGKQKPAAPAYFRMATEARDSVDKLWFLTRAGLESSRLRGVLQLLEGREEPYVHLPSLASGPFLLKLPFPAALVPNPQASAYFVLTKDCTDEPFFEGQTVIIDSAEVDERKLAPFWEQIVLLRIDDPKKFPPEDRGPFHFEGYRIGVVSFQQDADLEKGIVQFVPVLERINRPDRHTRIGPTWRREHGRRLMGTDFSSDSDTSDTNAALREMEVYKQVSVMGRVIAWFAPSPMPKSYIKAKS